MLLLQGEALRGQAKRRGKVIPSEVVKSAFFLNTCYSRKRYCELCMGLFGPVTELSLATLSFTVLLLLPCESRGAWIH